MPGAYDEARELLREFGGLLGRARHEPASAEHLAYAAITRPGRLDFDRLTRAMASRPRAFGSAVTGSAHPRARGTVISRSGVAFDSDAPAYANRTAYVIPANDVSVAWNHAGPGLVV